MNMARLSADQHSLVFDVRRSIRYHDHRAAFFVFLHRVTGVLTVLLGGGVLFDVARPGHTAWWMVVISIFGALFAAVDFVTGFANSSALHRSLRARFILLERDIANLPATPEAAWDKLRDQRLEIEMDEPTIFRALDLACHNELLRADGYIDIGEKPYRISRWAYWTRHLFAWPNIGVNAVQA